MSLEQLVEYARRLLALTTQYRGWTRDELEQLEAIIVSLHQRMQRQITRLSGTTIGGRDHYFVLANEVRLWATRREAEAFLTRWQLVEGIDYEWLTPGQLGIIRGPARPTVQEERDRQAGNYGFYRHHLPESAVLRQPEIPPATSMTIIKVVPPACPSWTSALPCVTYTDVASGFWDIMGDPSWQPVVENQPEGYMRYSQLSIWDIPYRPGQANWTRGFPTGQGPPMLPSFRSVVSQLYVPQRVNYYTLPYYLFPVPMRFIDFELPYVELNTFSIGASNPPPLPTRYIVAGVRFLKQQQLTSS